MHFHIPWCFSYDNTCLCEKLMMKDKFLPYFWLRNLIISQSKCLNKFLLLNRLTYWIAYEIDRLNVSSFIFRSDLHCPIGVNILSWCQFMVFWLVDFRLIKLIMFKFIYFTLLSLVVALFSSLYSLYEWYDQRENELTKCISAVEEANLVERKQIAYRKSVENYAQIVSKYCHQVIGIWMCNIPPTIIYHYNDGEISVPIQKSGNLLPTAPFAP